MTSNPEQIREEIERTRASLSDNVDALAYEANPAHMAQRQVQKVKASGTRLLDRVMGAAEDARDAVTAHGAGGAVSDRASAVGDAMSNAPQAARRQAQGNPVAAGLVAFGLGLLIASLIPASRKEEELAQTIKEQAQPLTDQVVGAAKEVAGNLAEPAQQAVENLKESATEAVQTVKDEGQGAVSDVQGLAKESATDVKDTAQQAAGQVKNEATGGTDTRY
jgi:uncharacterized protein YjbJ (UPF0337 family)